MNQTQIVFSTDDVESYTRKIIRQVIHDKFTPDYIVGITRGGLVPAVMISHWLDIPMHALHVRLRDGEPSDCESNCWMPEDVLNGKKILIVDDINDSGATLNWIVDDWQSSVIDDLTDFWGNSIRTACLVDNVNSDAAVNYSGFEIAKTEEHSPWIVFPWEEW